MGSQTQYQLHNHLGLIQDILPEDTPAEFWTAATNVHFQDGASRRTPGWAQYASPLPADQVPFYGASVRDPSGNVLWLWTTKDKIWVTDGATHTDITPAGGLATTDPGTWTITVLGGIPVLNNPNNPPMYWDLNLANPCLVLPDWPAGALCQSMRAVKYHLVALNITEGATNYPNQLWWSASAVPGAIPQEWIPSATNDAGDTILGDEPGVIIDAAPLRDQLIIYKSSSTYVMQYVAGQYVYAFRKLFPSIGADSLNCAATIESQQVVFTGEDVIVHDGQNYQSIVDKKVQRTLVRSIRKESKQMVCVIPQVVSRQVQVCIPASGGNANNLNYSYIINVDDGLVGTMSLPNVYGVARGTIDPEGVIESEAWDDDTGPWDLDTTIWTQNVYSPTNDSLMMFGQTDLLAIDVGESSADNGPVLSNLTRLSMKMGNGIYHTVVTQIAPRIDAVDGTVCTVRMGSQDYFNQPISWGPAQDFTVGTTRAISSIIDGRYLSVQFLFNTENDWAMSGYYLKQKQGGEY